MWLKEITGAKISVPRGQQGQRRRQRQQRDGQVQEDTQTQNHPVQVNAFELPNLLHSFHEISQTSSTNENNHELIQQTQNHPVRVNTFELSDLLHSFHEISLLLSQSTDFDEVTSSIPCNVKMRTNSKQLNQTLTEIKGQLFFPQHQHNEHFSIDGEQQSHLLFQGAIVSGSNATNDTLSSSMASPQSQLCAYSVHTTLSEDNVATIVDNVRFVDTSVD